MGSLLQFPSKYKNNKVSVIPNIFTILYQSYKKRQDDIKQRKIDFLEKQAFQYFYDIQEDIIVERNSDKVELPHFIQEQENEKRRRKIAQDNASRAMLQVIEDGRVNECYSMRIKQLKQIEKQARKIQGK